MVHVYFCKDPVGLAQKAALGPDKRVRALSIANSPQLLWGRLGRCGNRG